MSNKRDETNKENAAKSTGPRSKKGKEAVRMNAFKHGILSSQTVLPDEDQAEFDAFKAGLEAHFTPVGSIEALLVERLVAAAWRLRRIQRVEVSVFEETRKAFNSEFGFQEDKGVGYPFISDGHGSDAFSRLSRYESSLERGLYRAIHELQRIQGERNGEKAPLPIAVEINGGTNDQTE